eukprot:COSAG01_NODE_245_length_20483_cov_32.975314_10_plen_70_part_00
MVGDCTEESPHEGPLWHPDCEIQRFPADAFADGMEVISSEEMQSLTAKAGISDTTSLGCNIPVCDTTYK